MGFPESVRITNTEANNQSRGLFKKMVDAKNHIAAYGWIDGNPVHFLTTADGTTTTEVKRRIGKKVERIKAPIAIKRYNQNMHAVDRHDQLRDTFSLAKRHGFKKYYCKVAMGLLDMALVNAWLHFKLVHKEWGARKSGRYDFMNSMANALLQTDWNEFSYTEWARENERIFRSLVDGGNGEAQEAEFLETPESGEMVQSEHAACQPLSVTRFLGAKRKKKTGLGCQVCNFEGRGKGIVRSVVICLCHRIRLCTDSRISTDTQGLSDTTWCAPDGESCWFKAHSFYIPKGLFADNVRPITADEVSRLNDGKTIKFQCVRTGSDLYQKKHLAFGTGGRKKPCRRRSKKIGAGRKKSADKNDEDTNDIDDEDGDDGEEDEEEEEEEDKSFETAKSGDMSQDPRWNVGDSSDDELAAVVEKAWL